MRLSSQVRLLCAVLIVVGMAFLLRIWRLDVVPLRGDEAFTAVHWTNPPFSERWLFFLEYEPNPASMVVYWAWSLGAGTSEFGLRYFSVLANLLGVAVIMALARRLFARWDVALWAGMLWAIHPFLIWHAQDARQYGLYVTLATFNIYLLHRALHEPKPRWWAYIVFQTFTLYLYYFELFMVMAQAVYVLMMHRKQFGRFLRVWVGIGVLLIPLAVQTYVVLFGRGYGGTATTADFWALFTQFIPTLFLGIQTLPIEIGLPILLMMFVLIAPLIQVRWLLASWLLLPLMILFIASHFTAVFLPRYVIMVTPVFILIIAGGMFITQYPASSIGRYGVIGILALSSILQIYRYHYTDLPKSFDWRGLMAYVDVRSSADDVIINDTSDTALEYYHNGEITIFFIPEDNPPIDDYVPVLLNQHHSIFLLTGARTGDVQAYLNTHAQRLPTTWRGLEHFRKWEIAPTEIDMPLAIPFDDVARLVGYSWLGDDVLLLYWEALRQTDVPYNILTHVTTVLDAPPDGAILDHQIADNTISTTTWQVGTIYRDPIHIPNDLPSGEYYLILGMYDTTPPYTRLSIDGKNEDGRVVLLTLSR